MKRAGPRLGFLLLTTAVLTMAGLAWGAAAGPHRTTASVRHATRHTSKAHHAQTAGNPRIAPAAAMRIFKDPESNQIGPPTAQSAAQLSRELPPQVDVSTLPQVKLANGGYELLIDGKVEDAVVMKLDAKGHRVISCVTNQKAALQAPAPPAQREDR